MQSCSNLIINTAKDIEKQVSVGVIAIEIFRIVLIEAKFGNFFNFW